MLNNLIDKLQNKMVGKTVERIKITRYRLDIVFVCGDTLEFNIDSVDEIETMLTYLSPNDNFLIKREVFKDER